MKNKASLYFLAIGIMAAIIAVSLHNGNKGEAELEQQLFITELETMAHDIQQIKITTAVNDVLVSATKEGEQWIIDNLGGYPADKQVLARLVTEFKEAKLVEKKTAKERHFVQLHLQDIDHEESQGVEYRLQFTDQTVTVLLGKESQSGQGMYVRRVGDNQTWLLNKSIPSPTKTIDWVKIDLFPGFAETDIQQLQLTGDYQYDLNKEDQEQFDFSLNPMPEGRKLKYSSITTPLARAIAGVKLVDLVKREKLAAELKINQSIEVTLFNEESVILALSQHEQAYYLQIATTNELAEDSLLGLHASLWDDWIYEITEFSYNALHKDPSSYLEDNLPEPPQE